MGLPQIAILEPCLYGWTDFRRPLGIGKDGKLTKGASGYLYESCDRTRRYGLAVTTMHLSLLGT